MIEQILGKIDELITWYANTLSDVASTDIEYDLKDMRKEIIEIINDYTPAETNDYTNAISTLDTYDLSADNTDEDFKEAVRIALKLLRKEAGFND